MHGDVRSLVPTIPDQSVQCCVTSPPYWGLRDYEVASAVWGGDRSCLHNWGAGYRLPTKLGKDGNTQGIYGDSVDKRRAYANAVLPKESSFCVKCGAWLGQLGQEPHYGFYILHLVEIFRGVRRILRDDGVFWLNIGDSYNGSGGAGGDYGKGGKKYGQPKYRGRNVSSLKPKDLVGIPWRLAFALQQPWYECERCGAENHGSQWGILPSGERICPSCKRFTSAFKTEEGWYLRTEVVWDKPNTLPNHGPDRTSRCHEYVFLLAKSKIYFFDSKAILEAYTAPLNRWGGDKLVAKGFSDWDKGTGQKTYRNRDIRPDPKGRNRRSIWRINVSRFKGAHYAVFPEELVELLLKSGTSEKGGCVKCGAPWKRNVVINKLVGFRRMVWNPTCTCSGTFQKVELPIDIKKTVTKVYVPNGRQRRAPCVVFDPFSGVFTTALVAAKLGMDFIGTEVGKKYVDMGVGRLNEAGHDVIVVRDFVDKLLDAV